MLKITQLDLHTDTHALLEGISLQLHSKDRVGLVGRNGCGKTSLLRCIVGEQLPTSGHITLENNITVGYLPQNAVSGSQKSVWEEVKTALLDLNALEQEIKRLQQEESDSPYLLQLLARFEYAGGYAMDERIGVTLHGLGFTPQTWHNPCTEFSGGWQMRIALAKILVSTPHLAIMDEPTNHLDLHTRNWLAHHLSSAPYALIIVSHDQFFLDRVVTKIVEIRNRALYTYKGNFSYFIANRELRIQQQQSAFEKQQKERANLQKFVDRFGAKATKAKQAQSRKKRLEKMELIDAPQHLLHQKDIHFPCAQQSSSLVFGFKNAKQW